ncbi:MAG: biotin/lipoyl-binding protein [Pseudomonadales bacterium]|nr:biotin/lipoyl-binding protein [Pseudomonadales bacterium]
MADVSIKPISRLLVANRGEIARRIFRTAHEMGISTVAVYADGDADAPFVHEADMAIALNGVTSAQTYLDTEKVLAACEAAGADAVHPGYGFLSENAAFASAIIAKGITWVGPPIPAIEQMGDKLSAKAAMTEAKVPTLPAKELNAGDDVAAAAKEIGYPVLVKASAGGGGRGMRVVESEEGLKAAVEGARREAGSSFGDDTVFLERWLTSSRHVEIQILGDLHGSLVHLFERECSIQRRHQKVIEEAPSPAVTEDIRQRMGEAAVKAAQKIGYASAGTVEFLLDGDDFWFLEVNTRLQVEHPITEEITGLDLVREQIRIAEGEKLGYGQSDLTINGHAVEARLYAEDPAKNFLPSPGLIKVWEPAPIGRFDSGVESGSEVSVQFDPMIAKVIAHGPTRREAIAKLARALEGTKLQGITNNRDFLVATLRHPAFIAGDTTTDFIERVNPDRTREPTASEVLNAAIAATLVSQNVRRKEAKQLKFMASGWRNSIMPPERVSYESNKEQLDIEYRSQRDGSFVMHCGERSHTVSIHGVDDTTIDLAIDHQRLSLTVFQDGDVFIVHGPTGEVSVKELPRYPSPGLADFKGGLFAPMPGKVLATEISAGDAVKEGQILVVLEAMKMEHRITAPIDGTVKELNVTEGDQVDNGQILVVLEGDE